MYSREHRNSSWVTSLHLSSLLHKLSINIGGECRMECRSQLQRGLRRGSGAALLLGLRVRIPPESRMPLCSECCVSSGRGLCIGLITRPEESYRQFVCVINQLAKNVVRVPVIVTWQGARGLKKYYCWFRKLT